MIADDNASAHSQCRCLRVIPVSVYREDSHALVRVEVEPERAKNLRSKKMHRGLQVRADVTMFKACKQGAGAESAREIVPRFVFVGPKRGRRNSAACWILSVFSGAKLAMRPKEKIWTALLRTPAFCVHQRNG